MGMSPARTDKNLLAIITAWCLRHPCWALTLATAAVLTPYLARPFNLDEPLFIWTARQIWSHPADPFGFDVNWYGTAKPMWEVMQNPALMSYVLAAAAAIFGWSEIGLHFACWLPALAVVLGTWRLAGQYCRRPLLAALITLLAPGFLVASTTVMCDVSMLAFWVWAVVFWTEGIRQDSPGKLLAAGFLAALAILTKYNGICLLPLLAAHGWMARRSAGRWMFYLLIPVALLGIHEYVTSRLYGHPHFLLSSEFARQSARELATQSHPSQWLSNSVKAFNALTFAGGSFAFALFCSPWLWSKRWRLSFGAGSALLLFLAVAVGGMFARHYSWFAGTERASLEIQIWFWTMGGTGILALAGADAWKKRDAASVLLALWVAGIFLFTALIYWMVNIRVLLPMAPALAILIARRLEENSVVLPGGAKIALLVSAALALFVAQTDCQLAAHAREDAQQVCAKYGAGGGRLWFEGHWGFQYYMQAAGARALDYQAKPMLAGDRLAIPCQNANLLTLSRKIAALREVLLVPNFPWVATQNADVGAGFYSSLAGPLPFAFGQVVPEQIGIYDIIKSGEVSP